MVLDVQDWVLYVSAEVKNMGMTTKVQVIVIRDAAGAAHTFACQTILPWDLRARSIWHNLRGFEDPQCFTIGFV